MKLRHRLSIYFTAIILSIIAVLTYFSIQRESQALRNELKSQGQLLAFTLADESRRAFLTGHFVRLMGFVESIKGRSHLVYVMVRDIDGIVRVHSDLKKIKKVIRDSALDAVRKGGLYMREARDRDGHPMCDIAVPVEVDGRVVGVAQVGYSLSSLMEAINRARFEILFISLVGVLTGILLAYFASRHITHPIEKLRRTAKAYAKGRFDRRIEIKTGDEIAELGTAFNEMAWNLQGIIRELSSTNTFTKCYCLHIGYPDHCGRKRCDNHCQ